MVEGIHLIMQFKEQKEKKNKEKLSDSQRYEGCYQAHKHAYN